MPSQVAYPEPVPVRLLLSVVAGLSLWLAFPSHDIWPLAILGVALLALATRGTRPATGLLLGFVAGMAFFLPVLSWSGIFVGNLPWFALATLEALYIAVLGWASALLQRGGTAPVRPLAIAGLWVLSEFLRSTTPFGGFPWARLAFSQADSPLARLAALAGAPLVTFAVALAGGLLAVLLAQLGQLWRTRGIPFADTRRGSGPRSLTRPALVLALGAAVVAAPALIQPSTDGQDHTVLAVQGNVPEVRLDFNAQRRAVLDNHARLSHRAAERIAAGELAQPDLVVWPENAADIDPLRNGDAARIINDAVQALDAPTIVGAVLQEPADLLTNASLLYLPGQGVTDRYVKQHPVPFAEYVPYRSFFRTLSDKVDLVRTDFVGGDEVGVMPIPTDTGTLDVGLGICFEVAYDHLIRQAVAGGAELLIVPTNNATFGYTDESEQQLAISRIRAMEHGRSVVHVSTVGVSALITPDGTAHQRTSLYTPALLSEELPARTELTLATRVGAWPEWLASMAVGGLVLVVAGRGLLGRVRARGTSSQGPA